MGPECRRLACAGLAAVVLALAGGCATTSPRAPQDASGPPVLPAQSAVELRGRARGPISGLGDQVDLRVVVRGDGAVWAEIRQQPDEGAPVHEVLIWATDLALLFDRRTLRSTDLGAEPGTLEAWGGQFVASDALWVLAGWASAEPPDDLIEWQWQSGEWRGRREQVGMRRSGEGPLRWSETVWRAPDGQVHRLRVDVESHTLLPNGMAWPTRLSAEGTDLRARVVVQWDEVRWHPALGDSILDPLWEPPRP